MYSDTIIQDHAMFRVLLQAMSRPGSVCLAPQASETTGRHDLLIKILRCLMDNEVTCHVFDDPGEDLYREIYRATCSSRVDLSTADFLIFSQGTSRGGVTAARRGTLEYPDSGATVVYLVDELGECDGEADLHGPGIDGTLRPLISGLAAGELELLRESNAEFPLGLDALFLDNNGRIMCIPRSTRIGVN
jgi:alpha-D-ribose 1-methylphosphonate 5-triphosphate synthase subunit PhnH